jgi:sugar (pentulose or hexulose) kinase
MRILTIDVGSTSIKAGYWDGRRFLSHTRIPFATTLDGPRAEIPHATLYRALRQAGQAALAARPPAPDAVAFCAFSSGVVVTDAQFRPRTPIITHADRRSSAAARALVSQKPPRWWLARTGNLPYPGGIGSSTLAWLHADLPAALRPPCRVGQVSSLLAAWLAGPAAHDWVIDPSQAAFLGLWDIRTGHWNPDVCHLLNLPPAALPRVVWADSVFGTLGHPLARDWNLPAGIPLLGGFVDTSAAVLQTPMAPGQLAHSAGSTDVLALCVDRPAPADGLLSRPVGVGRVFPQRWLAVRTIASAGSALQWLRDTLFPDTPDPAWARLLAAAARAAAKPLGPSDTVRCLATFVGERAAIDQPPGAAFSGIRLGTSRGDLLAAAVRALVADSAANYHALARLRRPATTVFAIGRASALGDAMQAAWPARHRFQRLPGDSLRGLALLAQKTLAPPAGRNPHPRPGV